MRRDFSCAPGSRWLRAAALLLLLVPLFAGRAAGDSLPIHSGVLHFDPFSPGQPSLGLVGPAACGSPGEIVPALSMGVPWTPANCLTPGGDALVSDYPYHYEIELDIMGWVGPSYIRCQNGPSTLINFGPGADFVCHFNLPDSGGSGSAVGPMLIGGIGPRCTPGTQETGPLCRQHANFLTVPVAWGFSITEHPEPDAISVSRGNCIMVSGDQAIGVTVKVTDCDAVAVPAISDRGLLALGLVGIGATFVALRRGRPRRRSSGATG